MADIDVLPQRGVPALALVDSTGVASNGSQTVAQLASRGVRSVCAVDATGVSVGGATVAQLASAGIRAFCPVDETGVAQDSSTADMLRMRGIRPMVLLNNTGIALTGSATMLTLAQRGLQYFCPVDESGNATTMGAVVLISNTTVLDNASIGTNVGVLSVAGGTGTYTFSLLSNPGGLFATAGANGVNLNVAAALTAGTAPITVRAAGGVPTPIDRVINITVIPSPVAPANTVPPVISGTPTIGQILTVTSNGTWTGFPAPTFTYQWSQGVSLISGATSSTYTLAPTDVGEMITCFVKGTNSSGNAVAASNSLGPVAATGTGPTPPVMAMDPGWTGADTTPDFVITVDNTIVAGDSMRLQIQAAGGGWTAPIDDVLHLITSGEDSANLVTLATGALGNGNYEARTFVIDTVTGASAASNVVSFTVTGGTSSASTFYILGF